MSYKSLEIHAFWRDKLWKLADELVVSIHEMTLTQLPKFEMFEDGSQIRRSCKSVKSTIVEGYGRKKYKAEFLKFIIYSLRSNDETIDHLETLFITKSLQDEVLYNYLHAKSDPSIPQDYRMEVVGKKLNLFIKGVDNTEWNKPTSSNTLVS